MRIGKRKIAAAGALMVAAAGAAVAWLFWDTVGLLVVLLLVTTSGSLLSLWFVAESERRLRRLVARGQRDVKAIRLDDDRRFGRLERGIVRLHDSVTRPSEHAEQLLNAVHAGFTRIELQNERFIEETKSELGNELARFRESLERFNAATKTQADRLSDAIHREIFNLFRQLESLGGLYVAVRPEIQLPPTRDWAASPDLLLYLYTSVRALRPRLVLECGSGVSTVVLAYALRANGSGQLISLEHLAEYRETTLSWISDHGLDSWVDVRLAPLSQVRIAGELWPWYSIDQLPEAQVDLLLVDGPPGTTRQQARFPALPILADRLSPGALVILDDTYRSQEASVAEKWGDLYPDWQVIDLPHEKGTVAFKNESVISRSIDPG